MENKILLFALLIYLAAFASFAMADATDKATKQPVENANPVKKNAAKEIKKEYEPAARFTPTEKLRADDTVTFPVDI